MKKNATKIVTGALLGLDFKAVVINGKAYAVPPPTIGRIAGAGYYLADFTIGDTVSEIFKNASNMESLSKALSWFINGDESLSDEIAKGTLDEAVEALEICISLISAENFMKLLGLAKSVQSLIAKQR